MREGWKEVELGDITEMIKRGISPKYVEDNGVRIINQKCIRNNTLTFSESRFSSSEKKISIEKYLIEGDVVVNSTGTGTLGRTAIVKKLSQPTTVDTHVTIVRGNDKVDKLFLGYLLSLNEPEITSLGKGATNQIELSASDLSHLKVQIPESKNTQRKIASILSSYDDLIENNLKRIKLLEEKAQRTYEEWFVKMRFPGHETSVFNQETGLPEGWEKVKLGEVAEFKYGKMPKSEQLTKTGFPVYSGYRITGFTNKYLFEKPTLIVVARGVGGTGDVKISPEKCWLTNLSIAVVVKNNIFQNYLYYFLKDSNLRSLDSGAAQSQITIANLESYLVINADFNLQSLFNDFVDKIFKNINILQTQNRLLKEARDILLPRLMSGMVDVEELQIETIIK